MARVFVSHASDDLALVHEVHRWLVDAGHEVFLDQDVRDGIAVGEQWELRLHERLRWSDVVVCVVTSAYLASQWCAAEVAIARSRGSRLLPVLAEPGVAHPLLQTIQHISLTRDPVVARASLVETLRQVDAAGGVSWPDDRSPFPGLRPFEVDQHRVFFGRTRETEDLAELLRSVAGHAKDATLLVVGPSGCGKSSLVRAGLLPVMAGEPGWWTLPPIVPGADPVEALARGLAVMARQIGLDWTMAHIRHRFDDGGLTGLADEILSAAPGGPQRRLLVVVDQFEELFTQTMTSDRARFAELLRPALAGPVQLVGTLSPEFLDQLLTDHEIAVLPTHIYPLRPLRREALRAVIEGPARLAGIDVDVGLVDRLVEDTDSGEALPLLAFTLAQLADGVTCGGRLSAARYEQLGGVPGALIRQADAALADAIIAGGRSREQVISGLLRLVTVDEQGRPTRWRVPRTELPEQVITELWTFVTRRLLTCDTDNDTVVIGVAHEAFLSSWPPLAQAIAANVSALRARRAVEHAATEWHDNGRPSARLWGGGQLAAAVADVGARIRARVMPVNAAPQRRPMQWLPRRQRTLATDRADLTATARDFLYTSIHRDRYRRRRTITVLSVLLIIALTAAGVAVLAQRNAEEQQRIAQEQQRIAIARQLLTQAEVTQNTDSRTALLLGIAAHHIHPDEETLSGLIGTLTMTLEGGIGPGNPAQPSQLGEPLTGHSDTVYSVAFSPDAHTLATGSADGTTILWDITDPELPRPFGQPLTSHIGPVQSVAFSPDGRILATGSADGTTILWDITDPAQPSQLGEPLADHTDTVYSVAFSPDAHTLATGSADGTTILWDITDPAQPSQLGEPLTDHTDTVYSVAFSPDAHTLATGSADGTTIRWDITDPAQPRQLGAALTGHTSGVDSVAFSPDGRTLATGSADGTTILWDLTDPELPEQCLKPVDEREGRTFPVIE